MSDATDEEIERRFEFRAQVGRGAFGEVFHAIERETGRVVAIKRLLSTVKEPTAAERFRREAQLLARVNSPHVVGYVAHGVDHQGRLCLVLEWLEGEDLARRKRMRPLGVPEAVEVVRQAALGLDALHRGGVVHRDVKPSNFFVLKSNGGPTKIKLIDLGIARVAAEPALTVAGSRVGTPAYMSPEQARGDAEVTPRADLYSLGVVLYELVAGVRPFNDTDPFALLAKIVLQDPPPLRSRAPAVWPKLEAVVARAMARTPEARFQSALEMAEALASAGGWTDETLFDASSTTAAPSVAPIPAGVSPADEQRVVAALFAGFSPGPTSEQSFARFTDVVTAQKGEVHRTLGERAIAVFGQGTSEGEETINAARAALSTHREIPDAMLAVATCRVRLGASGLAGGAIERGVAMLERHATGVRVDAATARLLAGHFELEGAEGEQLLRSERGVAPDASPRLLGQRTTMVGRERELATLEGMFDECAGEPSARAVLVTAAAGVGKSRLRFEWLQRVLARDDAPVVLIARGDPMRAGSPFGLAADCVRRAAGLLDGEGPQASRDKLLERVSQTVAGPDAPRVAQFLGELVGAPFPEESSVQLRTARQDPVLMGDQMRAAFESWLEAECRARPVLVVLEDLHWGDLPSVRLFDGALRALRERPFMVLALARPEVHQLFPRLWVERGVQEIRLGNLTRKASERLVREVLGADVAQDSVTRLVDHAAGNAFYLEELIRAVAEGKGDELPETVLLMVQARLERLPPDARRALRLASVFGQVFWRGGLAALLGRERAANAGAQLAELVEREVLTRRPDGSFPAEEEFAFRHALLREAAYATLTDEDRKLSHRLAGEWLERAGSTDNLALAAHFARGDEPGRAVTWYLRAAEQALEGNDLDAALARAELGIAAGATGETLGALRLVQAEAHRWQGWLNGVQQCALEALTLLPRGSAGWCDAAGAVAFVAGARGRGEWLSELVEEIESLADEGGSNAERAALAGAGARVARVLAQSGDAGTGARLLNRVASGADAMRSVEPRSAALVDLARVALARARGALSDALTASGDAVESFERAGDARHACAARVARGEVLCASGEFLRAEEVLRRAQDDAARLGLRQLGAAVKLALGWTLARGGDTPGGTSLTAQAASEGAAQGDRRTEGVARTNLARLLLEAGDAEGAEREARLAVAALAEFAPARARAGAQLAAALHAQRRTTESAGVAAEALATLAKTPGYPDEHEVAALIACAEALRAHGDAASAELAAQGLAEYRDAMESSRRAALR